MLENNGLDKFVLEQWFNPDNPDDIAKKRAATGYDDNDLMTALLGLCEEAGEVAGKVKRLIRGDKISMSVHSHAVATELGDTLFYLTFVANFYGYTLDEIAYILVAKLEGRNERGTRRGSGDDR